MSKDLLKPRNHVKILPNILDSMICLQETWTNKNSKINLEGYRKHIHAYRRLQNRRAKRSSGALIIYIKDNIRKGVKLVKNDIDCLVWLEIDKAFFNIENDIFLTTTFIAPENSPIHNLYNISDITEILLLAKRKSICVWRFKKQDVH